MSQRTWRWLALFVVVDVVLVAIMLRHVSGEGSATATAPAAEPADRVAEESVDVPPVSFTWVASNGPVTVWGERGDCAEGTPVTLTRDIDGQRDTLTLEVTELLLLDVGSAGDLYAVGAAADCTLLELGLAPGQDEWTDPPGPIRRWHLTPGLPSLTSEQGSLDPGCEPVSHDHTAAGGDRGVVACADGTSRLTVDGGASWDETGQLDGITSVVLSEDGFSMAVAPGTDCAVAAYRWSGEQWVQEGCVSRAGGAVGLLTRDGDGYVAVVDEQLYRSDDAVTWSGA